MIEFHTIVIKKWSQHRRNCFQSARLLTVFLLLKNWIALINRGCFIPQNPSLVGKLTTELLQCLEIKYRTEGNELTVIKPKKLFQKGKVFIIKRKRPLKYLPLITTVSKGIRTVNFGTSIVCGCCKFCWLHIRFFIT